MYGLDIHQEHSQLILHGNFYMQENLKLLCTSCCGTPVVFHVNPLFCG